MVAKQDKKGVTNYAYDADNRLATVTEPDGKVTGYSFDDAGNRAT
jgi:YD repeat-containing protein